LNTFDRLYRNFYPKKTTISAGNNFKKTNGVSNKNAFQNKELRIFKKG